ncbi:MAG TPA: YihY/virulence factor BrkB family protein [Candidatus Angelobacter sp.]
MKDSSSGGAAAESVHLPESEGAGALLGPWREMLRRRGLPTLRYIMHTEVHTFAFSVAANAILSFFPFVLLLTWLVRNVLHSPAMFQVIVDLLKNQLPTGQDFVVRNVTVMADARHSARIVSVIILLISSSGVFLPLEVAFNRIWGFPKNRSYLGNQLISFLLALSCGVLGLFSVGIATGNKLLLSFMMGGHEENFLFKGITFVMLKVFAMAATVGIFFLIYWLLPNGKVPTGRVLPAAVAMGIVWEAAKYVYILVLPGLNFHDVYGPFTIAVTLMIWAYISGMLVLAGAHLAADPVPGPTQPPIEPALPMPER